MLRRHSWFMPLRTSSSLRGRPSSSTSGTWKLNCGCPAAKPPSVPCCCQPSSCSCATTQAPSWERSRGGTSPSRRTDSSAMPALTCSADQRRVTTGGPMRTAKAPLPLEVGDQRGQPRVEVVAGPVDDRTLGEVGEVALDLGQLAVEHEPHADHLATVGGVAEPAHRLRAPLGLHARPRRGLEEAGGRLAGDEVAVLLRGDGAQCQGGRHPEKATRDQARPPYVSGPSRLETSYGVDRLHGAADFLHEICARFVKKSSRTQPSG